MPSSPQENTPRSDGRIDLETLLRNLPGMAYRCKNDRQWTMEFVSEGCRDLTGYDPADLLGNACIAYEQLIHPDDRQMVRERVGRGLSRHETFQIEYRINTANQGVRHVWERGVGVGGNESTPPDAIEGFISDITELKRLEERLRHAQKMEAIGQLAGGIAHDFNNLLQVIVGYSELLLEDSKGDDPNNRALLEIVRASHRAESLVRQLLAFGRRQALNPTALDLNDLIAEHLRMIRRVLREDIELRYTPGMDLPPVLADAGQIELVLMNLCVNARDAMPDGGRLTIETAPAILDSEFCRAHCWAREGEFVLIRVGDTGTGMSKATLGRIFEPFFTTKGITRGSGLGLSTVYGIVEQHRGFLSVYSEVGHGTVFTIYLPTTLSAEACSEVAAQIAAELPRGTERILLAEDESSVREYLQTILESAGYRVATVEDGAAAVEEFAGNPQGYDLVILDLIMPRLGGHAASREILALRSDIPLLFASGYSQDHVNPNETSDMDAPILQKPCPRSTLLHAVRAALDL